ncbi:MAG: hypothetical protein HGA37_11160, partial [Lentimicrobium sp.]|nr:hypothetical protein [Lentimicrobium sp.]
MKQKFTFLSFVVLFLLFSHNSGAVSVFTVKGVALVCPSCNCLAMQAKGASFENCVDLAISEAGSKPVSGFDRIIRYSDSKVMLHSADGKEIPLASDDVQDQFNELIKYPGWEKQLPALRISEGLISDKRLTEIANLTGLQLEGITTVTIASGENKKWKPGKPSFILQLNANGGKTSGATIAQ